MESWNILYDILILLAAAFLLGTVAELLKQNAIVGYLLAGMAVGPFGFGLVRSRENMELIAEMGVALLLFSIGLEFSFKRLRSLGPAAIWGGILQISATAATGAGLAKIFGLDLRLAVFIGAMVCLSSTASVLRLLAGRAALDSVYGRNSLGILLVQDIAVLPLTLVLAVVAGGENLAVPTGEVLLKILAISGGVIGFYVVFAQIIPRLFEKRPWGTNRELPVILAIVMACGGRSGGSRSRYIARAGGFRRGPAHRGNAFRDTGESGCRNTAGHDGDPVLRFHRHDGRSFICGEILAAGFRLCVRCGGWENADYLDDNAAPRGFTGHEPCNGCLPRANR